ncbi:MAG TPA: adenylate/guanylate cyclase domain-containing protein [Geminicoccus sp.]|jgi:class 3 adenylate cyclase|uniref:adenylate/guanylate cyclase domain-containing protein n=1 Tax=Geminicoccus sp. TaxID=2024832 RepID=UPI002E323C36|nr:adenylate/guanylate cyclase domain-containing protein [Geminicoccus sp.]HEX2524786.1 adenylate/guanylate cyclase domain-containing protein [Geminicoccus sp.]
MTTADDIPHRQLLQTIGTGAALADPASWAILFENARFFQWFEPPTEPDAPLDRRIPKFDAAKAKERLAQNRPYNLDTEVRKGPRTISLNVEVRAETFGDQAFLVVEACDVSKQREAEHMLDSYARMVEKNTRDLQREKERVEKLLLNIMPRSVYEELKDFGTTTPQRFEQASILMLDFVGFTDMAIANDPSATIAELNDIFSAFDRIVELFGCERLKTIGDAYMAVAGLPEASPDHATNIAKVALRMRRYLERRNAAQFECRIGIATGPVIGSIIGIQKYVYDVFGPTVNLAARLESHSMPMQITVSEATWALIQRDFDLTERDPGPIKGFGIPRVFTLERESRHDRLAG